tara:strand:- start:14475 stop:15035 length:561 start_codon:yes stop_codon:yes gene_type:complete
MIKTFPKLSVDNFELRLLQKTEAGLVLNFNKKNEEHLKRWDPPKPEGFDTKHYWEEKALLWRKEFLEDQSCRLIIFKEDSMVGSINFTNFERGPFQNARLGYKICSSLEGQGVMSACLRTALDYVFKDLSLHRVEANCIPHNHRSRALLKRLGFVEHGIAKDYLMIDGRWQDHVLTSLVTPFKAKK